jgi:hypothetical protein
MMSAITGGPRVGVFARLGWDHGDSGDLAALRAAPGSYQGPGFSRAGKGRSRIPALAAAYGKAHPKIGPAQYCR